MWNSCSHCLKPGVTKEQLFSLRHPDKNKDPKAEDMFIKISKSYEVSISHIISYHNISMTEHKFHGTPKWKASNPAFQ